MNRIPYKDIPPLIAFARTEDRGETGFRIERGAGREFVKITGPGIWVPPEGRDEAIRVLKRLPKIGIDLIDTADS